ncbi:hypothetical protein E2C01_058611 [Portunus trituberculatus]|uniref:Uncharacterized protein n=1 Tax=Portunus trituberculatus TaxID=210409 RepID=A0A5B7H6M3_PORTR|nr:hypothetical protein [Portunus trituberculatus]
MHHQRRAKREAGVSDPSAGRPLRAW